MNIWRMKLRAGHHGPDMWEICKERKIVAMTYKPIFNTDLTDLEPDEVHKSIKASARTSIRRFAWQIQGGDEIYVGVSISNEIIAKGYVAGTPGCRAYRYNPSNPIYPPGRLRELWRHEIPVIWDNDFRPLTYKDGAPRYVVAPIEIAWKNFLGMQTEEDGQGKPLLDESPHQRHTKASTKNILNLHKSLSNRFRVWIQTEFGVKKVVQEEGYKDITFNFYGKTSVAELKICYGAATRHAIRAAIGQLFEYNHYPPRPETQLWWLVLDTKPSRSDFKYIITLKQKYRVPLVLSWPKGSQFEIFPSPPNA